MQYIDRLANAVQTKRNPSVVGLDPRAGQLPDELRCGADAGHAEIANAFDEFCRAIIDAVAEIVPAVKPQAAFFEALGPPGMTALHNVIAYARSSNLQVILDGKRNDIGSTAEAYASAYLGQNSAWGADSLTVSPYLGDDSLSPFVNAAKKNEAGIYVLVKTSNPGGKTFQDLSVDDGEPLYRKVASHVESLAEQTRGDCGYGDVGAVVGATYPEQLVELRRAMPHTWFLVPGFGAQGGGASDVAGAFDDHGMGGIVNSSRGIIFAYNRPEYQAKFQPKQWRDAVTQAAQDMAEQLRTIAPGLA